MSSLHGPRSRVALGILGTTALLAFATVPAFAAEHRDAAAAKPSHAKPSRPPAGRRHRAIAHSSSVAFYNISVHTGTPWGAGTDGDVWVRLVGDQATTDWFYLDDSNDNFERGQTDIFRVVTSDVGSLRRAEVRFDGAELSWYLADISVNGSYFFPRNDWMRAGFTSLPLA